MGVTNTRALVGATESIRNTNRKSSLLLEEAEKRREPMPVMTKFYLIFIAAPIFIAVMYAIAILFLPGTREHVPYLLWTEGALKVENGKPILCPRESICSEGIFQVFLISISRLTAFISYVVMGSTFLSKMHCSIHALSVSYVGTIIPFSHLHSVHKNTGKMFALLAVIHTVTHFIRWIVRGDMNLTGSRVGVSGVIAILSMVTVVWSMSSLAKSRSFMNFEKRFSTHWLFLLLAIALCFHTPRCRIITLTFS